MVERYSSQKSNAHAALGVVLVAALVGALCLIFWQKLAQDKIPTSSETGVIKSSDKLDVGSKNKAKPEDILTASGIVTTIYKSCSVRTLNKDDPSKKGHGICDSREGLEVNGKRFSTSSGGPQIEGFYINIDSIDLRDRVLIRYVINEYGSLTLDCDTCSVVRTEYTN